MQKSSQHEHRRYSEGFKIKVVQELESSSLNASELGKKYDIRGKSTISKWVKKYGKLHLLSKKVVIMEANEQTVLEQQKKRIQELERALIASNLDHLRVKLFYEQALRELQMEASEFEKKNGTKP